MLWVLYRISIPILSFYSRGKKQLKHCSLKCAFLQGKLSVHDVCKHLAECKSKPKPKPPHLKLFVRPRVKPFEYTFAHPQVCQSQYPSLQRHNRCLC
jgi:hypothetical protein